MSQISEDELDVAGLGLGVAGLEGSGSDCSDVSGEGAFGSELFEEEESESEGCSSGDGLQIGMVSDGPGPAFPEALHLARRRNSFDCGYDEDGSLSEFLGTCRASAPGRGRILRRQLRQQLREQASGVLNLEIDSGDRSVFSFHGLAQGFPNLRQLLYKTTDCLRVIYDLRGFGSCRNLRSLKLQLSFQTMCEEEPARCGVTALKPLAETLEVLEIGRLRFNVAEDLEVLQSFRQLKVLKYEGVNEGSSESSNDAPGSILDLRQLSALQELEFTETSFTAPRETGQGTAASEEDSSDDECWMCPRPSLQVLMLPEHLKSVTFKHQYGSRITPALRRLLRQHGCSCQEFVPEDMVGRGTLNFVGGFKPQTGAQIEAKEEAEKEKRRLRKEELRAKQDQARAMAFAQVPGLLPSSDTGFEKGEEVYIFEEGSFRQGTVERKPKKSTSSVWVQPKYPGRRGFGFQGLQPFNPMSILHPSCVFRELPVLDSLQLCGGGETQACGSKGQQRPTSLNSSFTIPS